MAVCPNRHENSDTLVVCAKCGLPLVNVEERFRVLTRAMADRSALARPKASVVIAGVGPFGASVVSSLRKRAVQQPSGEYVLVDVSTSGHVSRGDSEPLFSLQIGNGGSAVSSFCGQCEKVAQSEASLSFLIGNAGIREKDENQAMVAVLSLGEGAGSGIAPVFFERSYALNAAASSFAVATLPAVGDSLHNYINAYYGVSRLLSLQQNRGVDSLILLQHDRLKKARGVGPVGEELKMESFLEGLLSLLAITMSPPRAAKFAGLSRWLRTPLLVPCLALGHSLEIFGSLRHILQSSIAYPLCEISPDDVVVSDILLRIPRQLADSLTEAMLSEEISSFNRRYFPNLKASLFEAAYLDQAHDRIDACVLLGSAKATAPISYVKRTYEEFRKSISSPEQWRAYGLDEASVEAAERTMAALQ